MMHTTEIIKGLEPFNKLLERLYNHWFKDLIFIISIALIIFATQAALVPVILLSNGFNLFILLMITGFSIYWYLISLIIVLCFTLNVTWDLPNDHASIASSFFKLSNHAAFLLASINIIAASIIAYGIRLFIPYFVEIHFIVFVIAHIFPVFLLVRSLKMIVKGLKNQYGKPIN